MKSQNTKTIYAIGLGFIFTILLMTVLLTARSLILNPRLAVEIQPSGITPSNTAPLPPKDPNDKIFESKITVTVEPRANSTESAIGRALFGIDPLKEGSSREITYFNKSTGLVQSDYYSIQNGKMAVACYWFAGPKGFSNTPFDDLGRFGDIVLTASQNVSKIALFEKDSRCFYMLNSIRGGGVTKGPQISAGIEPVYISRTPYFKNDFVQISFMPPTYGRERGPDTVYKDFYYGEYHNFYVLDSTGVVYILDENSVTLSKPIGRLPSFYANSTISPEKLFAWNIVAVKHLEHRGLITAAISDDSLTLKVNVFDANGTLKQEYSNTDDNIEYINTSTWIYKPSALKSRKFAKITIESFIPTAWAASSFLLGSQTNAFDATHSFFKTPHTGLASQARAGVTNVPEPGVIWLPTIFISALCAQLIFSWAGRFGISKYDRKKLYLLGFLFGLPAVLTWLCLRPRITMVTCHSCGLPRRPDTKNCHHCGANLTLPAPQNAFSIKNPAPIPTPK